MARKPLNCHSVSVSFLASLVATNLTRNSRSRMDAAAEERYYRTSALPQPRLGTLVSLATAAGVFLILTGIAQV